jgi:hypothetical protein
VLIVLYPVAAGLPLSEAPGTTAEKDSATSASNKLDSVEDEVSGRPALVVAAEACFLNPPGDMNSDALSRVPAQSEVFAR